MRFEPTVLGGVVVIEQERHPDERGYFARTFASEEFSAAGLDGEVVHCSTSFNHSRGTLRGLHYQREPHAEAKLVRCTRGAIWDVAVDLRRDSTSFLAWFAAELTAEDGRALYIPRGCAHGYVTLRDESEVLYQMSTPHVPEAAAGVRWDDPAFRIDWPLEPVVMSTRDATFPDFRP